MGCKNLIRIDHSIPVIFHSIPQNNFQEITSGNLKKMPTNLLGITEMSSSNWIFCCSQKYKKSNGGFLVSNQ